MLKKIIVLALASIMALSAIEIPQPACNPCSDPPPSGGTPPPA
ncbi:MAG TPA: hypothetical protein VM120_04485 [Bryobacteraceae bacterium]|nr:hypothetical protein [Bryobacteraceae bacterium]